ncbi:hypothetical protein K2173_002729 [Erythroxylum novogranatense]|uniref:Kinesin motor domain-containing protein n=1 Tax=Erythroxylum novogranatense TaxID=1862640 RepID=A0AAV8TU19_9ROSI|nr:hypothetical protein K2173_002729 [Erythroxylum novogranatense]
MFISSEKEQKLLPAVDAKLSLTPFSTRSNLDYQGDALPVSESQDSISTPTIYTDVSVVPEHEKNELEQSIVTIEGEIVRLRKKERSLDKKRRDALNKILDTKGSIRVFCRLRPLISSVKRRNDEPISVWEENIEVKYLGSRKDFRFDKVFRQAATQDDIFEEVEPIIRSALDGHNVCILAYGQTATGKTFTMDGTNDQPGITPRALEALVHQASLEKSCAFTFSMSMLEVYMGNLRDLLGPKAPYRSQESLARSNLNIQTDPKGLVEIEGLKEVHFSDLSKAKWWYAKGKRARSTSWTNVNEMSSRSHCLMRITISRSGNDLKAKSEVSKMWMVDLGGSERLLKTGATGQTLEEGRAINLSLSALGDVIAALRRKRGHVPYRNSKLTQILKDSLGDSSKVLMLVHISPSEEDTGETFCSLNFANRARAVETNRELPEDINKQRQKQIREIAQDMRDAEEECQKVRQQTQEAEILLSKMKQLFSAAYELHGNREKTPRSPSANESIPSPKKNLKEVNDTPKITPGGKRVLTSSLPRFMTSTVASRQRQSAAEKEVVARARSWRPGTRSSVQFSGSQSFCFSDSRLKTILQDYNKRPQETVVKSPKCSSLEANKAPFLRSRMVTSSDSNLRVALNRHSHRRRMSDLI